MVHYRIIEDLYVLTGKLSHDDIAVVSYETYQFFLQIHSSKSHIFMKFGMLRELIEKN